MQEKNFVVYKSSAGSGKTHTLVKEYLKLVIIQPSQYRSILAITFTNKAANEMKQRILNNLKEIADFGNYSQSASVKYMLTDLITETGLDKNLIAERASSILQSILHNYSDFAITTIDSFIHGIIRSFAFDLKLPVNFEVEMDTDDLIEKVIDLLLSKVGIEEDLTKILVDFTKSKTDDEKSWNIDRELKVFAKFLLNEDSQAHIQKLKNLTLKDFSNIYKKIKQSVSYFEETLKREAKSALDLISLKGISEAAFYRGKTGISSFFQYIVSNRFDKLQPNSYVLRTIEEDKWYSAKASQDEIKAISEIKDYLVGHYNNIIRFTEQHYNRYIILNQIKRNLYPMALLNEIEKVIDDYKAENNILLISEFNKKIAEIVLNEPVPFIYERTGEKYKHFLIDEFQDTSELQWLNLIPLLDNSLAEGNLIMIVGDGKQAIYRWRNGDVEQFARLPEIYKDKDTPLHQQREMNFKRQYDENILRKNYRSKNQIVRFNNEFFSFISQKLSETHKDIYKDIIQDPTDKSVVLPY